MAGDYSCEPQRRTMRATFSLLLIASVGAMWWSVKLYTAYRLGVNDIFELVAPDVPLPIRCEVAEGVGQLIRMITGPLAVLCFLWSAAGLVSICRGWRGG